MTRKDIDKAAGEYSGSILGCKGSSVKVKYQSFIDGAEWRINSIWHNTKVAPCRKEAYIAIYDGNKLKTVFWSSDIVSWDKFCLIYSFKKWAYMDDLLPIKED